MILEILTVIAIGAAISFFWPDIVDFFTKMVIPYVRKHLGDEVAELLSTFIVFLDDIMSATKRMVLRGWEVFKERILKVIATFHKINSETAERKTESYIRMGMKSVVKQTVVEEIPWHELPSEVRKTMIKNNCDVAELDEGALIEKRFKERCKEKGLLVQEM